MAGDGLENRLMQDYIFKEKHPHERMSAIAGLYSDQEQAFTLLRQNWGFIERKNEGYDFYKDAFMMYICRVYFGYPHRNFILEHHIMFVKNQK